MMPGCQVITTVIDKDGNTVVHNQSQPIPKLDHDLSQIVTRDNVQLVSVGSHWELTGPPPSRCCSRRVRRSHQTTTASRNCWSRA